MREELRRCPFCGGEAWVVTNITRVDGKPIYDEYFVVHHCGLFGTINSRKWLTKAEAIAAWNRRAES